MLALVGGQLGGAGRHDGVGGGDVRLLRPGGGAVSAEYALDTRSAGRGCVE